MRIGELKLYPFLPVKFGMRKKARSAGEAGSLPQVVRGGDLFEHEVRGVRARDSCGKEPVSNLRAGTVNAFAGTVG